MTPARIPSSMSRRRRGRWVSMAVPTAIDRHSLGLAGCAGCNSRRGQSGVILLLTMLLLVVAASFVLASKLNVSSRSSYRDERTAAVLAQAKEALISIAATYPDQYGRTQGPGQLPCPDTDNPPNGSPNTPCGGAVPTRRLPWQFFGMNDLRDSSGAELWYAVSANYRNIPKAPGQLNSNTPGQLTLDGTGDIVALIIADPASRGKTVQAITLQTTLKMRTPMATPPSSAAPTCHSMIKSYRSHARS
jgi:hypothetical protein